jgi:hypothetical protein
MFQGAFSRINFWAVWTLDFFSVFLFLVRFLVTIDFGLSDIFVVALIAKIHFKFNFKTFFLKSLFKTKDHQSRLGKEEAK